MNLYIRRVFFLMLRTRLLIGCSNHAQQCYLGKTILSSRSWFHTHTSRPYTEIHQVRDPRTASPRTGRIHSVLKLRIFRPGQLLVRRSLHKAAVQHILQLYVRAEHEKYFLIFVIWQHYNLKRLEGRKWSRGQIRKDSLEIFFNCSRPQSMINSQVCHKLSV